MSEQLSRGLEEASCGGLLVLAASSRDPDLAPFVGDVHLGQSFLILPAGGASRLGYLTPMEREEAARTGLVLVTPEELDVAAVREEEGAGGALWAAVLERALATVAIDPPRLAVAGRPALGTAWGALDRLARSGWSFVDGSSLVRRHRKRKGAVEIEAARAAAAGVCQAFRRLAALLAQAGVEPDGLAVDGRPLTVGRCRQEIARVFAAHGLEQPEGNIVAPGAAAAVPHTRGDDSIRLAAGRTIVVDLFPRGLVFADCTRTFVVGDSPAEVAAAHAAVEAVLGLAHDSIRSGRRGWELQELVCDRLGAAGYETPISRPGTLSGYVHGLGHGVGFELHEYPSFARNAGEEGVVEAGDLLTLEPGLYDPEAGWGVRLEDFCLVTAEGVENLTPLPYALDPRAWAPAE